MTEDIGSSADSGPQGPALILISGFWLGAWAWAAVAGQLRSEGFAVSALTLPGLEAPDTNRTAVHYVDHVQAVIDALPLDGQAVLVAHSGGGAVATGVLDAVPERIARVIYVDSGPSADGDVQRPDLPDGVDLPLPSWAEFTAQMPNMLDGLSPELMHDMREGSVPHPGDVLRDRISLTNPARNEVPATVICSTFPSELVAQSADNPMFAPLQALADVTYLDLPTGHWPMWSKPEELAELIAGAARG